MATVLVIGASRGIGLEAVQQALEVGHKVRALSRSADGILIGHPNLEKVNGDALQEPNLFSALAGVNTVIQTLGVTPGPDRILKPTRLFSSATRLLVKIMRETGVRRLICVTGLGAGDSRGKGGCIYSRILFPLLLKRIYDDKDIQEDIIRGSELDWVIARPGLLTNGAKTGAYRAIRDRNDWVAGAISRADVADFLIKQIDDDSYLQQTPLLVKTPLPNL